MKAVDLLSWEVAVRCSSRSHPNTFSLFPTFLRTLLISSHLLCHLTFRPARAVCDRQAHWLLDCLCVCGSWMRDTLRRLLWNLLCGAAAAHVRDFDRAAVISFSSVHVVGYRLFPLCAALLLELMCWSWSVRTYFGFVSDSAKGELTKVSFWKHQLSHCRPNAPKANNKMHWILCVHYVALHFPLMHAIYFRMKGHTLAHELLLFSEVSMNMSFKVHHNVSLSLVTPVKPLISAPTWRPGSLQAQTILPAACHSHCWSSFL